MFHTVRAELSKQGGNQNGNCTGVPQYGAARSLYICHPCNFQLGSGVMVDICI